MTIEEAIKNLDDNLYAGDVNNLSTEALEKALEILEKVRDGKMIELPCKVGAEIFILIDDELKFVDLGKVEALSYQADGVWIFARYGCGLTCWHPLKDLGKEFFFDPYEAEKALKERERK